MTTPKWNDERTNTLTQLVGDESPVSVETVTNAAEKLETTSRSVAAKLRKMGYEVASMAKESQAAFSEDEAAQLRAFVEQNAGAFTYAEIAAQFMGGKFQTKQVQGKLLSMELTGSVKPTEKVEVPRTYTEAEEATFVQMVNDGAFVEDIASALGKNINSVRGKALSLMRTGKISGIPAQKSSHAQVQEDKLASLGDLSTLTVAKIAELLEKTERGVRTTLTRRGITCADYDGAAKKAKNDAARAEAA